MRIVGSAYNKKNKIKAVAIDPGFTNTGVFYFDIYGDKDGYEIIPLSIRHLVNKPPTAPNQSNSGLYVNKAENLFREYQDVIRCQGNGDVDLVFVELPHGGAQSSQAMKALCAVNAVIGALHETEFCQWVYLTPNEVKQVVSIKNPDKKDIMRFAIGKYPELQWITTKRENNLGLVSPDGMYYTNKNEHAADAVAVAHSGLETVSFAKYWQQCVTQPKDFVL